jgi:hypothetical protein
MILTKEIEIKANGIIYNYYKGIGYNIKCNVPFIVDIKDLSIMSGYKILVKCDYCGNEKYIQYSRYILNTNYEKRKYACSVICSREKAKETCMELYKVDNPSKLDYIKEKKKETCLNNYGVCHPSQSSEIEKRRKLTLIKKYGVDNPMFSEKIKNKLFETNLKKYGHKCSLCNEKIQQKRNLTWVKKYGGHPWSSDIIRGKIYYTMIKNNYRCFDSGYELYKKIVKSITNKIKSEFITNWNGQDYYDNEYIKNNFKLDPNDVNYPTIDHKISILHGYINDIPPENIGGIINLCVTKRKINSQKGSKNFDIFLL